MRLGKFGMIMVALVAVAAAMAVGTGTVSADPRDFTLINGSDSITITHIYVEPSGPDEFSSEDILGVDVLPPGESVFIYFTRFTPDNCFYDIKVLYADGGESEILDVNLCETDTVTFR